MALSKFGPLLEEDLECCEMSSKTNTADTLRRVPIFTGLSETELQFLAERAVPRNYTKGDLVFSEGDPCTGLFVIESGHLRISRVHQAAANRCLPSRVWDDAIRMAWLPFTGTASVGEWSDTGRSERLSATEV